MDKSINKLTISLLIYTNRKRPLSLYLFSYFTHKSKDREDDPMPTIDPCVLIHTGTSLLSISVVNIVFLLLSKIFHVKCISISRSHRYDRHQTKNYVTLNGQSCFNYQSVWSWCDGGIRARRVLTLCLKYEG